MTAAMPMISRQPVLRRQQNQALPRRRALLVPGSPGQTAQTLHLEVQDSEIR